MTRGEVLMQLAKAHAAEADAIRAQADAARQRVQAAEAIASWTVEEAKVVEDPDEAAHLEHHAGLTRMEILTLMKEATRYDAEAERADAQAASVAKKRDAIEQSERNAFVHR